MLLLLSSALALALLEVGVWLALGPQIRFPRHVVAAEFGVRINQPHARYRHRWADREVAFRINGQGMRSDCEFLRAKPAGAVRVISVGDSFTMGYEVAQDETFSSLLERTLRARGVRAEVLNAGVSGYGTAEAYVYLTRELMAYEPDLVLLSFNGNDLVDNIRSGLFRLNPTHGRLEAAADSYVPGGRLADFLNTNPLLGWLSESSNAFALVKEEMNGLVKEAITRRNLELLESAEDRGSPEDYEAEAERLAGALLESIYGLTRSHGVSLVIQSIPARLENPDRLVDQFPYHHFDVRREGVVFVPTTSFLAPWLGREPLVNRQAHAHWTPFSHRIAGEAIARAIEKKNLVPATGKAIAPGCLSATSPGR